MKSVVITGVTGFMGSNLKPYLKDSYNILGLSRTKNPTEQILAYDEIDKSFLDKTYAFIHLAGKAHDLKKTAQDDAYFKVNTDLTIQLFNQFLNSDCKVFVFMSTVKAAADTVSTVLDENISPDPKTVYGRSKLKAEQYILSKAIPEDKRVYILRPCMVHGPNNKGNLNLLYSVLQKGIPYPLGSFENERSFLSIDNLCFAIKALLELQPKSDLFQLADDKSMSTNALVKTIGEAIAKPAKIMRIPKGLIRFLAKFGDVLPLPINTEKLNKLTENYVVSNVKIKKVIGDFPLTSTDGIRKTIQSFIKK